MSNVVVTPFRAIPGSMVSIAATSTTANVAIPTHATTATAVRVMTTAGTANFRWRSGTANTVAATATDPAVYNNTVEVFSISEADTYVAAKTDSGACTVEFTFGYGS